MIKTSYTRRDKAGRFVEVELWKDTATHKVVMLRKITYYRYEGEIKKFRTDISSDLPEFEENVKNEIDMLQGILNEFEKAITDVQIPEEQVETEVHTQEEHTEAAGLAYTAQLLKKQQ